MTRSTASSRSASCAPAGTSYGMRASRILFFARTIRCASVGGGVRKARAISSVVRPHTSRSVSATCASCASAGWQQVKMRRSRPRPARLFLLDLGLHYGERLGVEVHLSAVAVLVVAVNLVAVAVDLELGDLVAERLDLRLRFGLRDPFVLRVLVALGARPGGTTKKRDGKDESSLMHTS